MDKIVVVGGRDLVTGFRLAGVAESYVLAPEEADAQLNKLFDRSDVGIVILEETHAPKLSLKTRRRIESASKPVLVQVGLTPGGGAETLQALIKRAIGVSLEKL